LKKNSANYAFLKKLVIFTVFDANYIERQIYTANGLKNFENDVNLTKFLLKNFTVGYRPLFLKNGDHTTANFSRPNIIFYGRF